MHFLQKHYKALRTDRPTDGPADKRSYCRFGATEKRHGIIMHKSLVARGEKLRPFVRHPHHGRLSGRKKSRYGKNKAVYTA